MPISVFPPANNSAAGVSSFNTRSGAVTLANTDVDGALGFTPYSDTNPSGFTSNVGTVTSVSGAGTVSGLTLTGGITGAGSLTLGGTLSLTSGNVTTALGFTPYDATNPSGYISGITSLMVTTALGFTPYNATNPAGYTSNTGTVTSVAALTLGTTGTDLSSTVATGTTTPVITLNVPTASAANRGALSSADWSTFNGKQAALVSGTNIKTINGSSVLGSGDLVVSGTVTGFWAATVDELTGTQASSVTGLANVTQLVEPMVANGVYKVDCFVTFRSAATTTGLNLGFTSPTGTICQLEVVVPITSTAAASQLRTIFPNAATATNVGNVLGTGVTAINSNHTARISGTVHCGSTPGDFQIQFASEVNASAITLQIGSSLVMQRIA